MENGMVFMSKSPRRETNAPRDHPGWFYHIEETEGGLVDVYLDPCLTVYETDIGIREYDISVRVVRGVVPWKGMEDDIRMRYDAWCESAEVIDL